MVRGVFAPPPAAGAAACGAVVAAAAGAGAAVFDHLSCSSANRRLAGCGNGPFVFGSVIHLMKRPQSGWTLLASSDCHTDLRDGGWPSSTNALIDTSFDVR